jgi:argininosuccinate lyase
MAYAHALGEAKILTEDEKNLILAGLKKVKHIILDI